MISEPVFYKLPNSYLFISFYFILITQIGAISTFLLQLMELYQPSPCSSWSCINLHPAAHGAVSTFTLQLMELYQPSPCSSWSCINPHPPAHGVVSTFTQQLMELYQPSPCINAFNIELFRSYF